MHNTMQMTAENNSEPVNNTYRGNEAEWSPHPSQKPHKTKETNKKCNKPPQKKTCRESSKDPHFLSSMGNMKHTQREEKGLSGRGGELWLEK